MPWWLAPSTEAIVCTAGCAAGYVPCSEDHAGAADNEMWQGESFYRCPECDFVRPDPYGENVAGSGTVACPECGAGDRTETFDGPCEGCGKRGVGAADRGWPEEVGDYIAEKRIPRDVWHCPRCHYKLAKEMIRDVAEWRRGRQEAAAAEAKKAHQREANDARRRAACADAKAYHDSHAHQPVGTCDVCGNRDYLQICDHDTGTYVCINCPTDPVTDQPEPPADAEPAEVTGPAPGWYPDPEFEGFVRWWSGAEWAGTPTDPQYATGG